MRRRGQRGFTLLETLVALGILVVTLTILVETQSTAALISRESERRVVATDLARSKLTEARLLLEEEGFTESEVTDAGDFDDFGDQVIDLEFADALDDYHWEYEIVEVELGAVAGLGSMMGGGDGDEMSGVASALGVDASAVSGGGGGGGVAGMDLSSFGLGPEMMSDYLSKYIRMVWVRVWWGDSSDKAEERGDEVIMVTHVVNPTGVVAKPPVPGQGG